jgi:hypothetical protein
LKIFTFFDTSYSTKHCLQILDLKKKQENQVQLLKEKQKSDEAAKKLQEEIHFIKAQKVPFLFSSLL